MVYTNFGLKIGLVAAKLFVILCVCWFKGIQLLTLTSQASCYQSVSSEDHFWLVQQAPGPLLRLPCCNDTHFSHRAPRSCPYPGTADLPGLCCGVAMSSADNSTTSISIFLQLLEDAGRLLTGLCQVFAKSVV